MDSNFDVDNIESLQTAVNNLIYIYNYYVYMENFFQYDMYILVKDIEKILKPYTSLYNNEEYNPFDSVSSVLKFIDGKDLSNDTILFVYEFCIIMIDVVLMKVNFVLANKINNNARYMTKDYLSELLNFLKESEYDNKSTSEWVEHFNTKVKVLESDLQTKTDHIEKSVSTTYITANDTSDKYNEDDHSVEDGWIEPPMIEPPMPAPAPKKNKTSYLSSFLPFMTRTNKKKGGMATRKKKYRRRYKKQIKRRTKKTRSTH
jgi:hypothetical protein